MDSSLKINVIVLLICNTQWYILKSRILLCTSWVHFWARIYFQSNIRAPKNLYITFKSNIQAPKIPYITFKSNIQAQKLTQIGSNIRDFKIYHWVTCSTLKKILGRGFLNMLVSPFQSHSYVIKNFSITIPLMQTLWLP